MKMMFDWDRHNLKKIKAHGLEPGEVEQALAISPILIYEQDADAGQKKDYLERRVLEE